MQDAFSRMSQDHLGIYYRLLKIAPGASAKEIKLAYRKLAFEFHPDRNTDIDAEEKFKDIAVMVGIALPEFKFQGRYSLSGSLVDGSILAKYGKYAKVTTC